MDLKSVFSLKKYRREPLPEGIFEGTVDVHTHLLPGVDDGFQKAEDSMEALRVWAEAGVKGVICTPHFMESYPANRRPAIEEQFAQFQHQLPTLQPLSTPPPLGEVGKGLPSLQPLSTPPPLGKVGKGLPSLQSLSTPPLLGEAGRGLPSLQSLSTPPPLGEAGRGLYLAAEYMVDDAFASHATDGYLDLGGSGWVLTETSYANIHPQHTQLLYDLSLEGYQIVIAHPERYLYASDRRYESWKRKGFKFQLNLLSLSGAYGDAAKEKAEWMLREGMYDYVGSDVHNLRNFLSWVPKILLTPAQTDELRHLLENNLRLL